MSQKTLPPGRRLIGLYGSKGVGKNFVADVVKDVIDENLGHCFLDAFAAPIKDFAVGALGIPYEACHGDDAAKMAPTRFDWDSMPFEHGKSGKMTVREILQVVGTELGRDVWGEDMWVKALESRVMSRLNKDMTDVVGPLVAVVTDVRFDNEVVAIREMGGEVWRVKGPQRIGGASRGDAHASEVQRDDLECDSTIDNGEGATKDSIASQVTEILRLILPKVTIVESEAYDYEGRIHLGFK